MWVLVLEALVALGMLILIVWLTMGSSRRRGEKDDGTSRLDRPAEPEDK